MEPTCSYCGMIHHGTCPKVKAIDYFPDGTVKRVEFHKPEPLLSGLDIGRMLVGGCGVTETR